MKFSQIDVHGSPSPHCDGRLVPGSRFFVVRGADMKPEELVAKHLDSIGTARGQSRPSSRGWRKALRNTKFGWAVAASCKARARWFPKGGKRSS